MGALQGKTAVVLGASAKGGSGWAIAEALAREGCKVLVAARRSAPLRDLAADIGGASFACDATKEDDIAALGAEAKRLFGKVDIAINSAGAPERGPIKTASRDALQRTLDLNYIAHVFFVQHMAEAIREHGSIVIVSSMSAVCQTDASVFAYSCAKAAANCLVRCAAIEYGPRDIRVNAICPGPIESAASRGLFQDQELRHAFEKEVPLGRIAQPEDIANAAVWLAGPAFVTGLDLQVNGGNFLCRFPTPRELPGGVAAFEKRPLPPLA
ncbi:SDR family NAD(P)-dependent oxidoreductase [Terricaulis sp.]|uniref:SDR family NAD(P)-dependent oxidoreductase n=1 Tax=Terricaulis sp. TaxID=2768686 RepID=UPI00378489DB